MGSKVSGCRDKRYLDRWLDDRIALQLPGQRTFSRQLLARRVVRLQGDTPTCSRFLGMMSYAYLTQNTEVFYNRDSTFWPSVSGVWALSTEAQPNIVFIFCNQFRLQTL